MNEYLEPYIIYDILNTLTHKQIYNLYNFIRIKLYILKSSIKKSDDIKKDSRYKFIQTLTLSNCKPFKHEFNDILNHFLNKDKIMSYFIINLILRFLYPC